MAEPPCNYYHRSGGIVCGNLATIRAPGKGTGDDPDGLWCFAHATEAVCDFPGIEGEYLPLFDDALSREALAITLAQIKEDA